MIIHFFVIVTNVLKYETKQHTSNAGDSTRRER